MYERKRDDLPLRSWNEWIRRQVIEQLSATTMATAPRSMLMAFPTVDDVDDDSYYAADASSDTLASAATASASSSSHTHDHADTSSVGISFGVLTDSRSAVPRRGIAAEAEVGVELEPAMDVSVLGAYPADAASHSKPREMDLSEWSFATVSDGAGLSVEDSELGIQQKPPDDDEDDDEKKVDETAADGDFDKADDRKSDDGEECIIQ